MSDFGVSVRLLGPGLCLLLAVTACTRQNPDWCDTQNDCKAGLVCDGHLCKPLGTGPGGGGRPGTGGNPGSGGSGGVGPGVDGADTSNVNPIDGPVADDGASADGSIEPPPCKSDQDCPAGMKACGPGGVCRACVSPAPGMAATLYCPQATKPFCEDNQCKGCHELSSPPSTPVCGGPTPHCSSTTGLCSECTTSVHCTEPAKPICGAGNKCVTCASNAECVAKDPAKLACLPSGQCAACGKHSDCPAATPACGAKNTCEPCTSDTQCQERGGGPGVCLTDPDGKGGRCATEEETIYVGKIQCSDTGKGETGGPFCSPQKAVDAVTGTRRVIVVRGPDSFFGMRVDKSGMPVHLIGINGAAIAPGPMPGIVVENTDLRVRGLTISGSASYGVQASGSAVIRLNRCIIEDNKQGGLNVINGAGFDVANSVFKGNGANGSATGAIGAAVLNRPSTAGRPARFRTSTIVDNVNGGVTCSPAGALTLTGILLKGNEINPGCTLVESFSGDPLFSATKPYHILENSPCRNKVSTGNAPWDDLDGQPRAAMGGLTDCGADDWNP